MVNIDCDVIEKDECGICGGENECLSCPYGTVAQEHPDLSVGICGTGGCTNFNSECSNWQSEGKCNDILEDGTVVKIQCPKACGLCTNNEWCEDHHEWCDSASINGECFTNPYWMIPDCPRSCEICGTKNRLNDGCKPGGSGPGTGSNPLEGCLKGTEVNICGETVSEETGYTHFDPMNVVEGGRCNCNTFIDLDGNIGFNTYNKCGICDVDNNMLDYSNSDLRVVDCAGDCFGLKQNDECGVCNGGGATCQVSCRDGISYSIVEGSGETVEVNDECGVCGGPGILPGKCDCQGNVLDECGVCGGPGILPGNCDCAGNVLDQCNVCGGNGICPTLLPAEPNTGPGRTTVPGRTTAPGPNTGPTPTTGPLSFIDALSNFNFKELWNNHKISFISLIFVIVLILIAALYLDSKK